MRRTAILCLIAIAACSKADNQANTTPADTSAVAPAPQPTLALADVQGTWQNEAMPENKDTVIARYTLWASADTTGWKMKFDHQADTLPVHVLSVAGDSVVVHVGPYKSALRKNIMVETHTVYRLQNGQLIGRAVAHYHVTTPDSVIVVRSRGTR